MATKKTNKKVYESKATTKSIRITSRASIKIADNFYTFEYCEERDLPEDSNIDKERKLLWDLANTEVDTQIEDVLREFKKTRK